MTALEARHAQLTAELDALPADDPTRPARAKALDRLRYCGGTDAAAIVCGAEAAACFGSPWEVWASRYAQEAVPPRSGQDQEQLALGLALEAHILRRHADRIAPDGLRHSGPATFHGPGRWGWMRGQIDSGVLDADGRLVGIVDAKMVRQVRHWFEAGDDGVRLEAAPRAYVVQVCWYLLLARLAGHPVRFADLCALDVMASKYHVRTIEPDRAQEEYLLRVVATWWQRHIVDGERPPDDHSEVCQRYWLWQQRPAKSSRVATDDERATALRWLELRGQAEALTAEADALKVKLLAGMDTERLTMGPGKSDPYIQVQSAGKTGKTLRAHRFETTNPQEQQEQQ